MTWSTWRAQVRAEQRGQVVRVVERVAAPEPRLLGQLGEGQEALGPAGVAQAPAPDAHRDPVDREPHAGPGRAGQPTVLAGQQARHVLAVAAEQLVRAHPGQDHLHPALAGRLAHQQRVDGGRVADRLVQRVHHARQQVDDVRRDLDLVQLDAELRRDLAGVDRVVRHGLQPLVLGPEGDRVGVDLLGGAVREHGDDAGVQAAGQEAGHGHVGDQVGGDRLLDDPAQVGRGPASAARATSATCQ